MFGEFDPDEFEILDEVGEDDETFEDTKQEVYLEIQSSNCNQDSLSINDPIVCMEPKESVSERLTSDAHADTAAKSPNSPTHENLIGVVRQEDFKPEIESETFFEQPELQEVGSIQTKISSEHKDSERPVGK